MKKQIFFLIYSVLAYCYSGQAQTLSPENILSDAEKIVGLSKCWSEAKYNFVYFDRLTVIKKKINLIKNNSYETLQKIRQRDEN